MYKKAVRGLDLKIKSKVENKSDEVPEFSHSNRKRQEILAFFVFTVDVRPHPPGF